MIDTAKEKLITIKDARKLFPVRPSLSTVFRWLNKGTRGVKLESVRIGGRRYTTAEAIDRFIDAQQREPSARKSRRRDQSLADAKRLLDAFDV